MSGSERIERHPRDLGTVGTSFVRCPWLLTIVLASILCFAYLLASLFLWGDVADRSFYANLGMIPIGLAASILAAKAAAAQVQRVSVWAWGLLAGGLACFWAGDVLYFAYGSVFGVPPFPSLADAGYLAYYPLLFVGLLLLPNQRARRLRPYAAYSSAGILLIGGAAAILVWFLLPTLQSSHDDRFAYALSVGYPFGDLLLLGGVAWLLVRGAWAKHVSLWLLCLGLLTGLGADVLFGYQSIQGSFQSGGLCDICYMLSWTAFAWAGYAEIARTRAPASPPESDR